MTSKSRIVKAILDTKISPSSKEIAAELVQAWDEEFSAFDSRFKTLAVEIPWYLWLTPDTLLIGVMDRIAQDELGVLGCEWKSAKEPKQNKDGNDSAYWNEEVWLDSIKNGPQLSVYGLALAQGTFVLRTPKGSGAPILYGASDPRVLVRAAVKASPPRFWPTKIEDGVFQFPNEHLNRVANTIRLRANAIRHMRGAFFPWALPGIHCTNRFHKVCPYFEEFCSQGKRPKQTSKSGFDMSDPGSLALKYSAHNIEYRLKNDPNLVVFSASSLQTDMQCHERYWILTSTDVPKEHDENLDIGTGLHAGVAELGREYMRAQATRGGTKSLVSAPTTTKKNLTKRPTAGKVKKSEAK